MTNPTFLGAQGAGTMGERMGALDWASTPVGPPSAWPPSLRTAVSMLLECQLPMYLAWGANYTQFYNDAYRPILGDKEAAALGNSAPETWSEIWPTIGPMWQEVLAGRPVGFDDFKLTINRFGYLEDCYFNFSYSPVRDDDGQVAGVLVTFAETTKRVVSERRLELLDQLAQATRTQADPSEVMKITARLLGQHLGVNRCAYAHVLKDQDTFDLIGDYNDGVQSIVGRYRFVDFGKRVSELMVANEPYVNNDVDTDPATADGDLAAYRLTQIQAVICVPLHKNGRFVAAMAVHQTTPRRWTAEEVDLVRTVVDRCWESLERMRAESALREEARSLEVLNRTGAALSAELDLRALLQSVTDAATELTGAKFGAFFYNGVDERGEAFLLYTLAGARREDFEKFGHPRPTALFGPTFRGDPAIRVDDILTDPRYGKWGPHHGMPKNHLPVRSYLAVPVIARAGEVIGGLFFGHPEVGVFTGRSEWLAASIASQAAIAVDNARLYARAQQDAIERSSLLESERAARLEAERAGAIKDDFLATLSHELRTPLSAITGWVHILRRKLDPAQSDLQRGVEVIERSTRTQVQLIDDLLDMSRIRSGKLRLELQSVAPIAFVLSAVDLLRPAADAAGVGVVTSADPTGTIRGDASRLQQVVGNLVSNAVKFTPRGGEIQVDVCEVPGAVQIGVSDTGVGIDTALLPNVFERFRQGDGSTTRKFGGLGLGLSIVRDLVELHGGSVTAHSEGAGRGARFVVQLPLESLVHTSGSPVGSRPVAMDNPDLSGYRLLVVDDDPDARDLLKRVLEDCGAVVELAANAYDALELVRQRSPDVLLSDISMPGMDGYELLRRIRALPEAPAVPIPAIALTAFARAEDKARAREAGYALHVAKPMNPGEVLAAVDRLTKKSQGVGSPK